MDGPRDEPELPEGVELHGTVHVNGFFHRPRRFFCAVEDVDRWDTFINDRGAGRMTDPTNQDDPDRLADDDLARIEALGMEGYLTDSDVPELIDLIRTDALAERPEEEPPQLAPNHVWFNTHMEFGPVDREPVPAEPPGFGTPSGSSVGEGVRIVVLDTGIVRHDWFPSNVDVSPDDDELGHGTFIAGVILRYAPGAYIESLSVQRTGYEVDAWEVADALQKIADDDRYEGVDIVHISMAGPTHLNWGDAFVELWLRELKRKRPGIVVVGAAGNLHSSQPMFPGASNLITAVAALELSGAPAAYSSRGSWVDAAAVGEHKSTYRKKGSPATNTWASWRGTSFAAPVVTGAIAAAKSSASSSTTAESTAMQLLVTGSPPAGPGYGKTVRAIPAV